MSAITTHNLPVNSQVTNNCHIEKEVWSETDVQELKYGMLTLALEELRDNRRSKQMKQEAWNWLMSETDSDHAFSVENCCFELGMCVNSIRANLKKLLSTGVINL